MSALVIALATFILIPGAVFGQSPPPLPTIFSGTVTITDGATPDGTIVFARVGDYISPAVTVAGNRYVGLTVGPPDTTYAGMTITFHIETVQADETLAFVPTALPLVKSGFNLNFANLPIPTPTATPIPTATPLVALPAAYAGIIIIAGGSVPENARLVARIGDEYESLPGVVTASTGEYFGIVLDPLDIKFVGRIVEFYLNGVEARTTTTYENGVSNRSLDIIFTDFPTPTPVPAPPTETPAPPTPTEIPLPATQTSVPPTPTKAAIPATETPVPPTPTKAALPATETPAPLTPTKAALPATETPVPPTPTPVPPTATPMPPAVTPTPVPTRTVPLTETPVPVEPSQSPSLGQAVKTPTPNISSIDGRNESEGDGGSSCNSTFGDTSVLGGAANLLFLFAPLGAIFMMKRRHRNQ